LHGPAHFLFLKKQRAFFLGRQYLGYVLIAFLGGGDNARHNRACTGRQLFINHRKYILMFKQGVCHHLGQCFFGRCLRLVIDEALCSINIFSVATSRNLSRRSILSFDHRFQLSEFLSGEGQAEVGFGFRVTREQQFSFFLPSIQPVPRTVWRATWFGQPLDVPKSTHKTMPGEGWLYNQKQEVEQTAQLYETGLMPSCHPSSALGCSVEQAEDRFPPTEGHQ